MQPDEYFQETTTAMTSTDFSEVHRAIEEIQQAIQRDSQIFFVGNGGSASLASHIALDLGKSLLDSQGLSFKSYSLVDNVAAVTAHANDVSFEEVFTRQLKSIQRENDVLICISVSGKSRNVVRAAQYCKDNRSKVLSFTGARGGELLNYSDICVMVPTEDYAIAENVHLFVWHYIVKYLTK